MKRIDKHIGIKSFPKFSSFGFWIVFLVLLSAFIANGESRNNNTPENFSETFFVSGQLNSNGFLYQASKNSDGNDFKRRHSPFEIPSSSSEEDTEDQEESYSSYFLKLIKTLSADTDFSANESSWLCHDFASFKRERVALFKLFHCWKSFLA